MKYQQVFGNNGNKGLCVPFRIRDAVKLPLYDKGLECPYLHHVILD